MNLLPKQENAVYYLKDDTTTELVNNSSLTFVTFHLF